jgi:hypothetical protein
MSKSAVIKKNQKRPETNPQGDLLVVEVHLEAAVQMKAIVLN